MSKRYYALLGLLCFAQHSVAGFTVGTPAGVEAGLAAGMEVIAVSTPFTQQRLHETALLSPEQIVDNPATLPDVVARVLARHQEMD